ncbi:MAG: type I DNA topoisomerase [Alphaproteobacteria bacterium]|nr:MAG: type I DNA topoisomerase [Alphaproteobacteria bacterium]
MKVVVVESPAKAKTINKYLGRDYQVLASYGHVRDLPAKDGSVDPEHDFAMVWKVDPRGEKRLREIAEAVKKADALILATDPDREGEAISWHIADELAARKALDRVKVERVVFNEVTRNAVTEAFRHPRQLNQELIEAYLARRALDYLVGFTLSPVLWRKLPGSRSAGRVQSVALRLICEREAEIENFRPREYWTVEARLATAAGESFTARLTHLDGRKLGKFDLPDEAGAKAAAKAVEEAASLRVVEVRHKEIRRHPLPPFTTSTLQQEASRKLGFSATRTMRIAQRLYEGVDLGGETVGLITYMRTDGVQVANEAVAAARDLIGRRFGAAYVPESPRIYKSKVKNAQEAHEAIRPTDLARTPKDVAAYLGADEARLYDLIWTRMIASQMASARLDQVAVDIADPAERVRLRATGSVVLFDGFLTLYQEGRDETAAEAAEAEETADGERRLPALREGETVTRFDVRPEQHFTQPPPRYTEASLVKKLEELGIGRPSTYASILQVLQDRKYVRLEKRRFIPEDRGRVVTAFLTSFFDRYFQYNFTADLEEQLDDISGGRKDWKTVLRQFWEAFSKAVEETKGLSITEVIDALDRDLGPHFFPVDPQHPEKDPRACPACGSGRLGLRLGRTGGFIGCSNYPECRYTRPLAVAVNGEGTGEGELAGPRLLGTDPETGLPVTLRKGPFGFYLQLGEAEGKKKPKRCTLPKGLAPEEVTLEKALALLALPRTIGPHPDDGEPVIAGIGRYGPYVKHGSTYRSVPADEDITALGLNRAVALLAEAPARRGNAGQELGRHPDDDKPVTLHSGRYGPYVKHGRTIASLPKDADPATVTLETAVELLAARAAKGKGATGAKKATKKTAQKPAKKTAKTSARKAAKKKTARKTGTKAAP